jgi:sortase (surface protein transpeptidase)
MAAVARPVRLRVPAIGVDTSLQPLHRLAGGSLQSPSRWQRAGYYADGVLPGQTGPAVIAGHIDSTSGPAVFYRLHDLRPGDRALVSLADGRVLEFRVDRLVAYPKSRFPTAAVYGPTPLPELRLVTCTGDFDWRHHNYLDNLVVYAYLASG